MLEKIKNTIKNPRMQQFKDVRVVGLAFFGVIVLLVSWNSIGVIQTNYNLQKQIARMEQQNNVHKLENDNQKLRNQYYNTDQFLELQARKQFGRALPGETLMLIPKEVALSKVHPIDKAPIVKASSESDKPRYQQNFEAWMDFFLHRDG